MIMRVKYQEGYVATVLVLVVIALSVWTCSRGNDIKRLEGLLEMRDSTLAKATAEAEEYKHLYEEEKASKVRVVTEKQTEYIYENEQLENIEDKIDDLDVMISEIGRNVEDIKADLP